MYIKKIKLNLQKKYMYILPIIGIIGVDFKHTDLLMHLNAAKLENEIKLVISSPGGFVSEASMIRNTLKKSGKILYSTNSGDVASAAVGIFLTPQKQNRTFNPSKGVFLIHLPYIDPKNFSEGEALTSEALEYISKELRVEEKELANIYSEETGCDIEIIKAYMSENKVMEEDHIAGLGFAQIEKSEFKAVALYNFNNNNNMGQQEVVEKLNVFERLLKRFLKNLVMQDVTGVELDFGEIKDPAEIKVGVLVLISGSPAKDGEYVMAGGEIIVISGGNGFITEIKPAEEKEVNALKKENDTLKTEITTLKKEIKDSATSFSKLNSSFLELKNQFTKDINFSNNLDSSENNVHKVRKSFKQTLKK